MAGATRKGPSRRTVLKGAAGAGVVGAAAAGIYLGSVNRVSRAAGTKVIVIGIDGMDPRLSERLMSTGRLPNLARLRAGGGFRPLGTSTPPQSPVAWANFITGAGPGTHGIFDFVHRHPDAVAAPFFSAAETLPPDGGFEIGDHKLALDFWPANHKPARTVLKRQGTPFWDYLDAAGVPSTFYDLPSNYPPSPSKCGHHRCLCGMGTPDVLGTYGTYQYFLEDGPPEPRDEAGGRRAPLVFENETARAQLVGPVNSSLKVPKPVSTGLIVHRDRRTNAVVIEIGGARTILKAGQWSRWVRVEFELVMPSLLPNRTVVGICRFYLQQVTPAVRLYVSPINIDPRDPAVPVSEPGGFASAIAERVGPFATAGFQEDHKARTNGVFDDDEYLRQATFVLEERFALLEHAIQNYDDGLLFFYFSSTDLQSHMFWWYGPDAHPSRAPAEAQRNAERVCRLYERLDAVIGDLYDRYGSSATIIVMSDHGFANFGRQFNLNTWLRDNGYLGPPDCVSVLSGADWARTRAYGLGINGLYLNLKGRERDGTVDPGEDADRLLTELKTKLEAVRDTNGRPVVRTAARARDVYTGGATELAPDLIVGYHRGYRASWATCLGDIEPTVLADNTAAWSADHCADALEVPGVMWCSKPIRGSAPSLVDVAPSILALYGLPTPPTMTGRTLFE